MADRYGFNPSAPPGSYPSGQYPSGYSSHTSYPQNLPYPATSVSPFLPGSAIPPYQSGGYVPPCQPGGGMPPFPNLPGSCYPPSVGHATTHMGSNFPPQPNYPLSGTSCGSNINKKAYYWLDWSSDRSMVPPTAVHGGVDRDGTQIYVGRAFHEGDWIPAKVIPERHVAYVAHGGGEHSKDTFQVLCEQRFDWIPNSGGHIPAGAVEGGRCDTGEPLYIGRVRHDGAHTVGKVHPSHGCLYIPYDSRELSFPDYEILVVRM